MRLWSDLSTGRRINNKDARCVDELYLDLQEKLDKSVSQKENPSGNSKTNHRPARPRDSKTRREKVPGKSGGHSGNRKGGNERFHAEHGPSVDHNAETKKATGKVDKEESQTED